MECLAEWLPYKILTPGLKHNHPENVYQNHNSSNCIKHLDNPSYLENPVQWTHTQHIAGDHPGLDILDIYRPDTEVKSTQIQ